MKILVIENVFKKNAKYGILEKTILTSFSILPTLYARQIAAITPKKHDVNVLNERYEKIDYNKKYDIIHINYTTSTANRAYEIADKFRKKKTKVVLSGMHASGIPDEAKKHADSVLLGRGEINWLTFLKDYENGEIKEFYPPEKYGEIKIPPTKIKLPGFVLTGALEATRGCPYRCEFCPESNMPGGQKYYTRPVEDVVDEIKKMPYKTIMFYDSSLTIKPSYTKELFHQMQGLSKKFFCNGNSDALANDTELVELSKKAGCIGWLVGFESISQQTIDKIGKKTNKVDEYHLTVENLHENKILVIGDFMFGFDSDTKNVFDETLKMIKKLRIDVADFCTLTPFPGTPIYDKLESENRLITKDWSEYSLKNVVFNPKNMTAEELKNGLRKMYRNYYSINNSTKRIIYSIKYGLYPFSSVIPRNIVATMNSKTLF